MVNRTAVFLGERAVVVSPDSVQLVGHGMPAKNLHLGRIDKDFLLLTGHPGGEYLAFFSDERFQLWTIDGRQMWSQYINTDKAAAHHIRFSSSGDALACIDDWDGYHRLHLFEVASGRIAKFGSERGPIGFDVALRAFLSAKAGSGYRARNPPASPVLLDREMRPIRLPRVELDRWQSSTLSRPSGEPVFLSGSQVLWSTPPGVGAGCVQDCGRDFTLSDPLLLAVGDLALIYSRWDSLAVIVHRQVGLVRLVESVHFADMTGSRVVLGHRDGRVEVWDQGCERLAEVYPGAGDETLAAALDGSVLRVLTRRPSDGLLSFFTLPV